MFRSIKNRKIYEVTKFFLLCLSVFCMFFVTACGDESAVTSEQGSDNLGSASIVTSDVTSDVNSDMSNESGVILDSEVTESTVTDSDADIVNTEASAESTVDNNSVATDISAESSVESSNVEVHVHAYAETVVQPSCKAKGYTLHECACGNFYKDTYTKKVDHVFGEWYVRIPATAFAEGEKNRVCSGCGKTEAESIPIVPHLTCLERGIDVYEVQRLAIEYVNSLENAVSDPTLIGTDQGGLAGWTLRISTYSFESQDELVARVKESLRVQYNLCIEFYSQVKLHVLINDHPTYEGDYFLYILYN